MQKVIRAGNGTFIIHSPISTVDVDKLIKVTLGISREQLVKEIRENRDGKYNFLYSKEKNHA